jgi:Tfp pilus assembly protein PilF
MVARAAALAPDCAPVLNNFAALESERGRPEHALELAEHALSVQPDYVRAHRTAARAAVRLARPDEAVAHAERYLAARRRDRDAMVWLRDLVAEAPVALRPRLMELAR